MKTSSLRDVLSAELAVLLPQLPQPANEPDDETAQRAIATALDRPDTEDIAALCLSGGGIRSAWFSLGVLQGLARFALLGRFHYLSTVSGGGYIGSWLSVWRAYENDERVFAGLTSMQATGTEPSQIKGLRANSRYLTPELGLLSADTWTAVAVYIRNLLLNWVLFLPLLTGCLLFPYWFSAALAWAHEGGGALQARPWLAAGCVLLTIGLARRVYGRYRGQGLWSTGRRLFWLALAPIVLSAFCFTFAAVLGGIHAALGLPTVHRGQERIDAAVAGAFIYGFAWLFGRIAARRWVEKVLVFDLICWILSGALVGLLIALCLQFVQEHSHNARLTAILGLSGVVLAYLAGDFFYVGAASTSRRGDMEREWSARTSGWLAAVAVSWSVVSALSLYVPPLLPRLADYAWAAVLAGGISGLAGIVTLFRGVLTVAMRPWDAKERLLLTRIASVAAVIFAASIGVLLSILGQRLMTDLCLGKGWCTGEHDSAAVLAWLGLPVMTALIGASLLMSLFVNVNRFSLHALYRDRLVQAFLGSARTQPQRSPDPVTGFDPRDNANLATVIPRSNTNRLFHVINTTLNARKAMSFTMTRLYCGNPYVGYQPTATYAGLSSGITLGTALAISGAPLTPNQGYSSSPLVGFFMMLFNVRLGWWLGNPSREFYGRVGPLWNIVPALKLAGVTTDRDPWIYLSDGGHFDNLGLYEMVRRRCRYIVVVDAGCDPDMKFEDLGNTVRRIYIDFGVRIDFKELEFRARENPPVAGARFGMAAISYPRTSPDAAMPRTGWLLYIKPTYYGTTEGVDVRGYASDHPAFPHENTITSESQLESYRALGAHIVEHICTRGSGLPPGATPEALSLESLRAAAQAILEEHK